MLDHLSETLARTKLLAFDMDGTLTDSIGQIVVCFTRTFERANLPVPSETAIKGTIGISLPIAIQSLLPDPNDSKLGESVTELYRQTFIDSKELHETILFDGVLEMLDACASKGIKLAIASGKSRLGVNRVLSDVPKLQQFFKYVATGDMHASKPNPDMLLHLCQEAKVSPSEVVGVGDAKLDIQMCHNAKSLVIGVETGVEDHASLKQEGADFILASASDIQKYL